MLRRLQSVHSVMFLALFAVGAISLLMLYSAARGHVHPWAFKQGLRFLVGLVIMCWMAVTDVRTWYYLAYPLYALALLLLVGVEFMGFVGMGAQRWLDLYIFNLQPSEVMKIALLLALARYFHDCPPGAAQYTKTLIIPCMLIGVPALLVMRQPDLGTAMLLIFASMSVFFAVGVQIWKFLLVGGGAACSFPFLWMRLHDYQKKRILIFLDPEMDPKNAGYHVTQSKIAIGSGGIWGKGFRQGTQAHLNFLPEKQTDFIFTMLCEEWGLMGAMILLSLYAIIITYCLGVAIRSRNTFAKVLALSLTMTFFFYIFINIAMVTGLAPVVGVPLPLVSYGGTSMITVLASFGLVFSVRIYQDVRFGQASSS